MRRSRRRLAVACLCVVAGTIFAMPAGAGNGNGNGNANAPGQQKEDDAAAAQPAPQPAPAPQQQSSAAPAQQQSHAAPGQAKKSASSTSTKTGNASSSTPGVKPTNSTTHWTHCQTGGSSGAATCAPVQGTPNPAGKSDVSKRYGNGKTAAQIAVSRGGVGVILTGPGNSQPHKTYACGHKDNPSGGVDVHAIKSYDASACASVTPTVIAPCGSTAVAAKVHEHGAHIGEAKGKGHAAVQTAGMSMCGSSSTPVRASASPSVIPVAPTVVVTPSQKPTTGVTAVAGATASSGAAPTKSSSAAPQSRPAVGGVLGAHTTITKPTAHHGVLGTVAHVTGGTLPFTGFPIWVAVLIAAGLVAGGFALRRRGAPQV